MNGHLQGQHAPMSWAEILIKGEWKVLIARIKLLKIKSLDNHEACPLDGCDYWIVSPCPACGRHMAHGEYYLDDLQECTHGDCYYKYERTT